MMCMGITDVARRAHKAHTVREAKKNGKEYTLVSSRALEKGVTAIASKVDNLYQVGPQNLHLDSVEGSLQADISKIKSLLENKKNAYTTSIISWWYSDSIARITTALAILNKSETKLGSLVKQRQDEIASIEEEETRLKAEISEQRQEIQTLEQEIANAPVRIQNTLAEKANNTQLLADKEIELQFKDMELQHKDEELQDAEKRLSLCNQEKSDLTNREVVAITTFRKKCSESEIPTLIPNVKDNSENELQRLKQQVKIAKRKNDKDLESSLLNYEAKLKLQLGLVLSKEEQGNPLEERIKILEKKHLQNQKAPSPRGIRAKMQLQGIESQLLALRNELREHEERYNEELLRANLNTISAFEKSELKKTLARQQAELITLTEKEPTNYEALKLLEEKHKKEQVELNKNNALNFAIAKGAMEADFKAKTDRINNEILALEAAQKTIQAEQTQLQMTNESDIASKKQQSAIFMSLHLNFKQEEAALIEESKKLLDIEESFTQVETIRSQIVDNKSKEMRIKSEIVKIKEEKVKIKGEMTKIETQMTEIQAEIENAERLIIQDNKVVTEGTEKVKKLTKDNARLEMDLMQTVAERSEYYGSNWLGFV